MKFFGILLPRLEIVFYCEGAIFFDNGVFGFFIFSGVRPVMVLFLISLRILSADTHWGGVLISFLIFIIGISRDGHFIYNQVVLLGVEHSIGWTAFSSLGSRKHTLTHTHARHRYDPCSSDSFERPVICGFFSYWVIQVRIKVLYARYPEVSCIFIGWVVGTAFAGLATKMD